MALLGLRYNADLRTLSFLALYVALTIWMWRNHTNTLYGSLTWFVLWWTLTFLSFTGAVATVIIQC
jgi:hypothetical protein